MRLFSRFQQRNKTKQEKKKKKLVMGKLSYVLDLDMRVIFFFICVYFKNWHTSSQKKTQIQKLQNRNYLKNK